MSFIGKALFGSGKKPAQAAVQAAETSAGAQREALQYLKEREAIPREISETALRGLQGIYLPEGDITQEGLIAQAEQSPLYQAILGNRKFGEEAILRQASATGGLRSGNVQQNFYDYNTQLRNQALLEAYNQQLQGIQGLAGLPSNANNIAQLTAGIGETQAQGIVGAAQARQTAKQQGLSNLLGLGQLGVAAFSDIRLKKNIHFIESRDGWPWYEWEWSDGAKVLGLEGKDEGLLAHHVFEIDPEAVGVEKGFLVIDYGRLGFDREAA